MSILAVLHYILKKKVTKNFLEGKMVDIVALIINGVPADAFSSGRRLFELPLTPKENLHYRLPPIQFEGYMEPLKRNIVSTFISYDL